MTSHMRCVKTQHCDVSFFLCDRTKPSRYSWFWSPEDFNLIFQSRWMVSIAKIRRQKMKNSSFNEEQIEINSQLRWTTQKLPSESRTCCPSVRETNVVVRELNLKRAASLWAREHKQSDPRHTSVLLRCTRVDLGFHSPQCSLLSYCSGLSINY